VVRKSTRPPSSPTRASSGVVSSIGAAAGGTPHAARRLARLGRSIGSLHMDDQSPGDSPVGGGEPCLAVHHAEALNGPRQLRALGRGQTRQPPLEGIRREGRRLGTASARSRGQDPIDRGRVPALDCNSIAMMPYLDRPMEFRAAFLGLLAFVVLSTGIPEIHQHHNAHTPGLYNDVCSLARLAVPAWGLPAIPSAIVPEPCVLPDSELTVAASAPSATPGAFAARAPPATS
jgi:hypothetical protein